MEHRLTMNITPGSRFGQVIADKCNDLGWDARKLAEETELTYEALRKIINGVSNTSKAAFDVLVKTLKLNKNEMEDLITKDRIEKKHGTSVDRILKKNPLTVPFEKVLPQLTQAQRESFLTQMESVAKSNRLSGKKVRVQ